MNSDSTRRLGRVALCCRFKPVHLGQVVMLESILERADHLIIGIGSTNKYDVRNPFTVEETRAMLGLALGGVPGSHEFLDVPDLDDGPRWRLMMLDLLGDDLDLFVTANDYVRSLLEGDYPIRHPAGIVPRERWVRVNGTIVRTAMARGEPWRHMVPDAVADYLEREGLVDRFRSEFGLETIAQG